MAVEAGQWRADAEAAAEGMTAQVDAAQARPGGGGPAATEADPDTAIEQSRQDAATRIAAADADWDVASEQARAEPSQQVNAALVARDQAIARAPQEE